MYSAHVFHRCFCTHVYVLVGMFLPRSGITSLQGKARGMMECWYTRADRQPGERTGNITKAKDR